MSECEIEDKELPSEGLHRTHARNAPSELK